MKKIWTIVLLFSSVVLSAQPKNRASANFGLCRTGSNSGFINTHAFEEGGFTTGHAACIFLDTYFLFEKRISKHFFIPLGIGLNQKGFEEKGMVSDGSMKYIPYKYIFKKTYLSFYAGISYDLLSGKKYSINLGQLFNPEICDFSIQKYKVVFSTRTNLSFHYRVSEKLALKLEPFFQTALADYENQIIEGKTISWRPYGYGLSVGVEW